MASKTEERNALEVLANELAWIQDILCLEGYEEYGPYADKAQRIIAELAKEFEPIDVNSVEPGEDGRIHLVDYIKARDNRRCEIMIRCRAIAEE